MLSAYTNMFVLTFLCLELLLLSQIFCNVPMRDNEPPVNIDGEVIHLSPILLTKEKLNEDDGLEEMLLEFSAFGRIISLKLKENHVVGPQFNTFIINSENTTLLPYQKKKCHFLHKDNFVVAAISNCHPNSIFGNKFAVLTFEYYRMNLPLYSILIGENTKKIKHCLLTLTTARALICYQNAYQEHGFIFMENTTLEINPIQLQSEVPITIDEFNNSMIKRIPHLIKRAPSFAKFSDDIFNFDNLNRYRILSKRNNIKRGRGDSDLTLEVALFFDEEAYKVFSPYMSYNDENLRDMLLAYLNAVQALYKHPSIVNPLNIVLVRMDIMKVQPRRLPHYDGERSKLLNSFCEYQEEINPKDDENDEHWDMGLYISGLPNSKLFTSIYWLRQRINAEDSLPLLKFRNLD